MQATRAPWLSEGPRRAGVSSFGMGGTNAHAVLEEAPPPPARIAGLPWKLLVLSARSRPALEAMTSNLADHLRADPAADLAAVAPTLAAGRASFVHRRAVLAGTTEDAARALAERSPELVFSGRADAESPRIAFLYAGVGELSPGVAAALYRAFPVFREALDRYASVLAPLVDLDVRSSLLDDRAPVDPFRRWVGRASDRALSPLSSTRIAQPALLAVELALQALWASLGVVPSVVLGHSLGELAAAAAAGVFAPEDALALAAARARLIASLPPTAMTAVALSPAEIDALDASGVAIAAINGPRTTVVAGSIEAVAAIERRLTEREITWKRLDVEHAVHSGAMRPIAAALTDVVARLPRSPPRLPYLSNVTGALLSADEATRPAYWAEHLCNPVALAPAIDHLVADPGCVLVEIGPGAALASLARLAGKRLGGPSRTVVSSLSEGRGEDVRHLLAAVAELWLAGVAIDWRGLWPEGIPGRVPLPTYLFERSRHWIDGPAISHDRGAPFAPSAPSAPSMTVDAVTSTAPQPKRVAGDATFAGPRTPRERALITAFQASFGLSARRLTVDRVLVDLVARHAITILDFVPSIFDLAINDLLGAAPRLASLRDVILGGEAIRREPVARFQAVFPGVRVINLYGPTEASIGCIFHVVDASSETEIPIGRPIANVCAILLDSAGRLSPIGATGEIHLGGAAVGLGYHSLL